MSFVLNILLDRAMIIWGIFMHLLLLWGVMDINFHSPIVSDLSPVPLPSGTPAKRVFLFVVDGLRYRTFQHNPPAYIRKIMFERGVWGISHTRMPTESRPGNIAITAGLYEDPSAIFKGWKENPVDFDSVFNRSRMTFAWGSPDIISIFSKDGRDNIHGKSYPPSWQEFGKTSIRLDEWVFDNFFNWLDTEAAKIKDQNQIILFFHLLGCDTAGHASKPKSKEYLDNMKYVDSMIEKAVQSSEKFFEPGTTSYIYTSDHGMTDWGAHGSGSSDETETPFVAWGAGIKTDPLIKDIRQADITPLISVLAGIPIPVNNEGVLPQDVLNFEETEYGAYAFLTNAKQLSIQVTANRIISLGMSSANINWRENVLNNQINNAENLLIEGKIGESLQESKEAIVKAKEYLSYFRTYYRNVFLVFFTIMWANWILLLIFKTNGKPKVHVDSFWFLLNNLIFASFMVYLLLEYLISGHQNFRYFFYGTISIFSIWLLMKTLITSTIFPLQQITRDMLIASFGVVFLVILMYHGLSERWILSLAILLATALQTYFLKADNLPLLFSGILLSVFPMLPNVEPEPRIYYVLLSVFVTLLVIIAMKLENMFLKSILCGRLILTMLVCLETIDGRSWASWLILITTPLTIPMHSTELKKRVLGIVINSLCPLALLSSFYEPLFYLTFAGHLLCWPLPSEQSITKNESKRLNIQDLIKASYLMLYTLLSFFGTGNMASISSFDPTWTHNFVTVFSPFTMTALIVFKIVIPMILVGCICRAFSSNTIFLSSLLLGDCIAFLLMYDVTPYGSWLDIGSAISRFTIAVILPCFLMLLHWIAYPLLTLSYQGPLSKISKKLHFT